MEKKKLIVVLGSMGRGGAERVISIISDYFCKKGWKVWIVLLLFNDVSYELHENVEIVNLAGNGGSRIKRLPNWLVGIRRIVKSVKPDCVLSFAARINIIVQIACTGLKQKIIVSERNDPYMDGRSKMVDVLTNILYPRAEAVVFQTRRAEGYFDRLKLKNACIISNPISVPCGVPERIKGKIVTAGRLTPQKNHKLLIQAFSKVIQTHPEATLYIYGDGELRTELEQISQNLGIQDKVVMPGNISNIHEKIADANVFVLSSDYEGLSNSLLEAMMMGIPCVSTKCAGSDEVIIDGKNGVLIDIGDEVGLVNALNKLIDDDEFLDRLSHNSVKSSESFKKENVLTEWEKIIN